MFRAVYGLSFNFTIACQRLTTSLKLILKHCFRNTILYFKFFEPGPEPCKCAGSFMEKNHKIFTLSK